MLASDPLTTSATSTTAPTIGLIADRLIRGGRATGVGGYVAGLARSLSQVSGDHVMLALPEPGLEPCFEGLPVRRVAGRRGVTLAGWTALGWPRLGRRQHVDLVHCLVPTVPIPTDVPFVATVHDLMPLEQPDSFPLRSRQLYRLALRRVERDARHIITVSDATRSALIGRGVAPGRVTTVYQGRPGHFRPLPQDVAAEVVRRRGLGGRPRLVFLGEVAGRKDPLLLVEAFAAISAQTDATLVIAGSPGSAADAVRRRVDDLDLRERVHVTGHLDASEAAALVQTATVFVLPSRQEGFGLPVLEAMSVGTPVVVSDAGALPELVGDAGLVFARGDRDALAAALRSVLSDQTLRTRLATAGRVRAEEFTWQRAAAETIRIHHDVLSSG